MGDVARDRRLEAEIRAPRHGRAEHERMPVPEIVERALEHYRRRVKAADEPMADFLARLQENAVDIDLEAIIKEGRTASRRDRDIEF